MRIGEFAKKHGLTIDAIRHYMDLQLILPEKKGGHYIFGNKEEKDLREILELKRLRFTLSEIQKILGYLRLSQLRSKEDQMYIRSILLDKKRALEDEKQDIQGALEMLQDKIDETDRIGMNTKGDHIKSGIYLSFMAYLTCPTCDIGLELEDGKIKSNMVMEGKFRCQCGYSGNVEDGIYISLDHEDEKKVQMQSLTSKVKPATTLGEYLEGTEASLIHHIYKSIDSIINFMDMDHLDQKIILELGTGSGFFIRQFLSHIKPNTIYIVTDHNIDRVKHIKSYVEQHCSDGKFIFICTDLSKLPIKNQSVDYTINYLTSLNYSLRSDGFLDSILIPKIKKGGKVIGCSYYAKPGSKLLKFFPPTTRRLFEEGEYKSRIKGLPLNHIEVKEIGPVVAESKYEIIIEGRELYTLVYCGEGR